MLIQISIYILSFRNNIVTLEIFSINLKLQEQLFIDQLYQ